MNPAVELTLRIVAAIVILACFAAVILAVVEFTLYNILNHHNNNSNS